MQTILWTILAVLTWAGFMVLLRGAMLVWPVGLAGAGSRVLTVVVLLGWIIWRGQGWRRLDPCGLGGWLTVMGLVSILINLCWFAGLQWTSATDAALLFRLDLLFVVVIGAAMGLERITPLGLGAGSIMLGGLVLLVGADRAGGAGHATGDALIVVAALGLAANAFVIRRILRQMDEQAVAVYNHAVSGVGFAALAVVQGLGTPATVRAHPAQWGWLVALGLAAAVSLPIYYAALRRLSVWKLRVFMLTGPLVVAVTDWLLWGERLHGPQWLGAALLLGGAGVLCLAEARCVRSGAAATRQAPADRLCIDQDQPTGGHDVESSLHARND